MAYLSYLRVIQIMFWVVAIFLIAPNKVAAVAYALLGGGLLIVVIVALGIGRVTIRAIEWVAKGFRY